MSISFALLTVNLLLVGPSLTFAQTITYVDATDGASGNTTLANGNVWYSTNANAADGLWRLRLGYGLTNGTYLAPNGTLSWAGLGGTMGTVYEAGGDGQENCSNLITTVNGLLSGTYEVYAFYWSDQSGSPWRLEAALTNNPPNGQLPLYIRGTGPGSGYNTPVQVATDNAGRILWEIDLGKTTGTSVQVYIKNDPNATSSNDRTWYDGIGYSPVGFAVNGGGAQTNVVIGSGSNTTDVVVASGSFIGAYAQNQTNTDAKESILINPNGVIGNPQSQGYWTNISTTTSGGIIYTNFNFHKGLVAFNQGSFTNYGAIDCTNSALPASTSLIALETFADYYVPPQNENYYFGDGVVTWGLNTGAHGPALIVNGSASNSSATINSVVDGIGQGMADGIYSRAQYGAAGSIDSTVLNFGTINGSVQKYDGTACGIYNYCNSGGQAITNYSGANVTASASFYVTAIYANCNYGNIYCENDGTASATSTGGLSRYTTNQSYALGADLNTYEGNVFLFNKGVISAIGSGLTNTVYGLNGYAQGHAGVGGAYTVVNSGIIEATSSATGNAKAVYCGGNGSNQYFLNSGTIAANAGSAGGYGLGMEQDTGNSITVINSGSISNSTGLGLFLYATAGGPAVVTNTGAIFGGNEGIAAEHYTGNVTIYDYGSVEAGTPNNNAMNLGAGNDTVHLYGLPAISGTMNGGGGTNILDFELTGHLQAVNGTSVPTNSSGNLTNYDLGTTGNITVSGITYKWSSFNVIGQVSQSGDDAKTAQFSTVPMPASDSADLSGDGYPNLEKRAFGMSLLATNPPGAFNIQRKPTSVFITFPRNTAARDLTITLFSGASLGGPWISIARSTAGTAFVPVIANVHAAERGTNSIVDECITDNRIGANSQFYRLSFTH